MEAQMVRANLNPAIASRIYLAFSSLAVLAMMLSLNGTSVSVALPVRLLISTYLKS